MTDHHWCDVLDIAVPCVDDVVGHREAKPYSLLITALLERGEAMTLEQVAQRLEAAGLGLAERVLRSLKRCKPARAPVLRDGDHYTLDPHHPELGLWAFRLDLVPKRRPLSVVREEPPIRGPDEALTIDELREAWQDCWLCNWSDQRIASATIEAHGRPLTPAFIKAFVGGVARDEKFNPQNPTIGQRNSPLQVLEDGTWSLHTEHEALTSTRAAVRKMVGIARRRRQREPDPAVVAAYRKRAKDQERAESEFLANAQRVLVRSYPEESPVAIVVADLNQRSMETFEASGLSAVHERLRAAEIIVAMDVYAVLRGLQFDARARRLHDIGPPQKTKQLSQAGRVLKITQQRLLKSSCGFTNTPTDPKRLKKHLDLGQYGRLKAKLEADAQALCTYYRFSLLHRAVRLSWRSIDEMIPAPWAPPQERTLFDFKEEAFASEQLVDLVIGRPAPWDRPGPWRSRVCRPTLGAGRVSPGSSQLTVTRSIPSKSWRLGSAPSAELLPRRCHWAMRGSSLAGRGVQCRSRSTSWP